MGFSDVFKTKQFKSEIEQLTAENEYLKSLITPDMQIAFNIHSEINHLKKELVVIQQNLNDKSAECEKLDIKIQQLNHEIDSKKEYLIFLDDEMLYQDFALYTPVYNLMNSEAYKDKLQIIRQKQKIWLRIIQLYVSLLISHITIVFLRGKNLYQTM